MMWRNLVFYVFAALAVLSVVKDAVAVPRWFAKTEQVEGSGVKPGAPNYSNLNNKGGVTDQGMVNPPNADKSANTVNVGVEKASDLTLPEADLSHATVFSPPRLIDGHEVAYQTGNDMLYDKNKKLIGRMPPDGALVWFDSASDEKRNLQNKFCATQKAIAKVSKEEVNKIAYQKMNDFSGACGLERELGVIYNKDGKILNYKFGDNKGVPPMELYSTTLIHIHNHPYDKYATWPSMDDMGNVYAIQAQFKNALKKKGCDSQLVQERNCFHYIVVCSCDNKPSQLLRYDEDSVFVVAADGKESQAPRPNFVDAPNLSWDVGHEPFRYDQNDFEKLKTYLPNKNTSATSGVGSVACWCKEAGVRGWCKCDPHERGVVYLVGDGTYVGHRQIMIGDYEYALCRRCGRVIKPSGAEGNDYGITDQRIVQEFEKRRTRGMTTSQIVALNEQMNALLRQANEKLLLIPDGSVIAPGLCMCKIPDPIEVGWGITDEDDFYVCNFCGRIREPDDTGNMDLGPTMLHEMGLMKHENEMWKRISQLVESDEITGK